MILNSILNCRLAGRVTFSHAQIIPVFMKRKISDLCEPTSLGKRRNMRLISLDTQEQKLANLLLDVTEGLNLTREEPLVLRFAGGWVRDKLLGKQSKDVDIAINLLTGSAFAEKLKEYLTEESNLKKHALEPKDVRSVHTIKANPDKSKHLETVTTKIFDLDVDLVNLRKETYTDGSRNPEVEFGDEKEDAQRRDATINAIFYNIHSKEVEDFTGGLRDLEKKIIRTPLDPKTTFHDDPLRILRLIRFASRYSFEIDPKTEQWMSDPDVLDAFRIKITRERVGEEVKKMLKEKVNNPNGPVHALQIIDRVGLYNTVFSDPEVSITPGGNWKVAYTCLSELESGNGTLYQTLVRSEDDRYAAWLLAALSSWTTLQAEAEQYSTLAAKNGLKLETKLQKIFSGAFKNYQTVTAFKNEVIAESNPEIHERDTIGLRIRRWESEHGSWRFQTLLAILVEVMRSPSEETKILSSWQKYINYLDKMYLLEVDALKPLVDGNKLMKALGKKGGPWTKEALNVCIGYQLKHELASKSKEEIIDGAIEEVRKQYG